MTLSEISIYPVKSCGAIALDTAAVEARGLAGDRRWMIVREDGRFVTAREAPSLVTVAVTLTRGGLEFRAPGMPSLAVAAPLADLGRTAVTVWKDETTAGDAGDEAAAWCSEFLDRPCRLVHQREEDVRSIAQRPGGRPGDAVSFADGYPLLVIGSASLAALNERLATPVSMARFRPNVVVTTTEPFVEDTWTRVRIGDLEFDCARRCTRCVLTTVDPASGEKHADGEPLKTLRSFRFDREERGILFGVNLIPRGTGRVAVGDRVTPS
ncbi:MAG: MOSC N-terminal beta barrel domain-containing protein [Pseudomonadota bacterium]